ncbi:Coiled-coil domain-containing protein 80, partial [Acipenser ruthenus]
GQTLQSRNSSMPILAVMTGFDFLAEFAGKHRLWVITAPTFADNYYRMMEKQMEETQTEGLVCKLAKRDTFIVILIHNAMMEDKEVPFGSTSNKLVDPDLIAQIRKDYKMVYNEFFMVVTDYDLRLKESGILLY